jgi:hypothetical protein
MPALPKQVHQRLASEFRLAASKVAEAENIEAKLYFFSVFYGETGRQLNVHWDPDLALLFEVVQAACLQIGGRVPVPPGVGLLPNGLPEGYLQAMDEVSDELAGAFEGKGGEVNLPRLYAALARTAELTYVVGGNGAYLHMKGMIKL